MLAQFGAKEALDPLKIVGVYPDGFHQLVEASDKQTLVRGVFHSRSPFLNVFGPVLTQVHIAKSYVGKVSPRYQDLVLPHFMGMTRELDWQLPTVHLLTATKNPDAHPETTTVDGYVRQTGLQSFASIRAASGDDSNDEGTSLVLMHQTSAGTGNYDDWRRVMMLFDLTSVSANAVFKSPCTLSAAATLKTDGMSDSVGVVTCDPASNTDLANSDYALSHFGSTRLAADKTIASLDAAGSTYNDWALNTDGLKALVGGEVNGLAFRLADDIDNSDGWVNGATSRVNFVSAEAGGSIPKLVLNWVIGGGLLMFL